MAPQAYCTPGLSTDHLPTLLLAHEGLPGWLPALVLEGGQEDLAQFMLRRRPTKNMRMLAIYDVSWPVVCASLGTGAIV